MNYGRKQKYSNVGLKNVKFNPQFSKTDLNLERLSNKILETGKKNFSILCYGPSGTGKSAYGIHLANQMKMKYKIIKASDLLSMWLGETEKNIANMFETAKENDEFIILDEADSFFQNRNNATKSWEVSQVNEILVGMENHNLPFICTTNLEGMIDPAAFRRFTFKLKYDYLDLNQRKELYKLYFNKPAPNELRSMNQLAPGDFVNIAKKMEFLGDLNDEEIIQMLEDEQFIKPSYKRKMGF